jgi:hypothetical protein
MTKATALLLGLGLYLVWTFATFLFEGRIDTLARPDAVRDRLIYLIVANVLIGIVGSIALVRLFATTGLIPVERAGFRHLRHALLASVIGFGLGLLTYAIQGPTTLNSNVMLNGFMQVLVVSIAEVLVCWSVVGTATELAMAPLGRTPAAFGAAFVASALFAVSHYAHSSPYDSQRFVLLFFIAGLCTSVFFFLSRDVYGAVFFHNFLGMFGLLGALHQTGAIQEYRVFQPTWLVSGAAGLVLLVALHVLVISRLPRYELRDPGRPYAPASAPK